VFYGSNLYRKDNPCWGISNATETREVLRPSGPQLIVVAACVWDHSCSTRVIRAAGGLAASVGDRVRSVCGICAAWLIGLPRCAGTRLHATNDAEARWWGWQVTERCGGLGRRYRDARFAALRHDPSLRRDELREDLAASGPAVPQCPDCPLPGDL
jgi:hypothetical protein